MKRVKIFKLILCLLCIVIFGYFSNAAEEDKLNLLSNKYPENHLQKIILPAADWYPFPKASDREGWSGLPAKVRTNHIAQAEKHLNCEWETPKASVFLEYVRNGNRSNYQSVLFNRRSKLAELVLGECMEGKGRFMDDVLNGIWTICEETYWGVPAHLSLQQKGNGLPDVTEPTVDLFAAETGMLLSWTYYLLGDQLDSISPLINERILYEVNRRILDVNLERDDFWWMGLKGNKVNNWNPWVCSNWLTAVLILEQDPERRIQSVKKILRCLDQFLNHYPKDGGCDEGPNYWGRAAASLYDCLELLNWASKGEIDIYDNPLIREMGRYIYRTFINDRYFINFADASAIVSVDPSLVYRYGKSIRDETMMSFGSYMAGKQNLGQNYIKGSMGRVLPTLFILDELNNVEPASPFFRDFWLPELQVMGARSYEGSAKGLYLAAKGGHNAESHNHNDVGSFIVYIDGFPAIIDVGVETYTAKTFSNRRYEIWTMQSAYHNLPTINGIMQKEGEKYNAKDVHYQNNEKKAIFSLDIANAYPEEAGIDFWKRTMILNRGKQIVIQDKYKLKEVREELVLSIMTWKEPEWIRDGKIRLQKPDKINEAKEVFIEFEKNKYKVNIEEIEIADNRLKSSWGEKVYRILFTVKETLPEDELRFYIEQL
ncbi:MAG: heparinase II/III family protein [Bacteroidales bacterium]|nr:heparinase II/III family protein [Bacteroidales bacterium]